MTDSPLTPFLAALLSSQQGIITAFVASRFNPDRFEENMAAVRATMRLGAIMQGGSAAGQEFDQIFDLYLQMFRTGDVNSDGKDLKPNISH